MTPRRNWALAACMRVLAIKRRDDVAGIDGERKRSAFPRTDSGPCRKKAGGSQHFLPPAIVQAIDRPLIEFDYFSDHVFGVFATP